MDNFLILRLREIHSCEEITCIMDTLAKRVAKQHEKIKQVIQNAPLDDPRISHCVSIGLSAEQPLEVTLFPGMLEGLLGHLKICSSDSEEAPHSMQARATKAWGEVVHEAAARSGIAQAFDGPRLSQPCLLACMWTTGLTLAIAVWPRWLRSSPTLNSFQKL